MFALRQSLLVAGFIVGIVFFFVGAVLGMPAGLGMVLFLLDALGVLRPGIIPLPLQDVLVSFAMAFVVMGGGILLLGSCFNRMGMRAHQVTIVAIFGGAATFFLYCALLPYITTQGRILTGLLFVVCATAAIFVPLSMSHDAKVQEERRRRRGLAMQGYDPSKPWHEQEDGSAAFHALPDREHHKPFH